MSRLAEAMLYLAHAISPSSNHRGDGFDAATLAKAIAKRVRRSQR